MRPIAEISIRYKIFHFNCPLRIFIDGLFIASLRVIILQVYPLKTRKNDKRK